MPINEETLPGGYPLGFAESKASTSKRVPMMNSISSMTISHKDLKWGAGVYI